LDLSKVRQRLMGLPPFPLSRFQAGMRCEAAVALQEWDAELAANKPATETIPPQERLRFDQGTLTVWLDGQAYEKLNPTAFRLLEVFWERRPNHVSSSVLRTITGLKGKNIPRELNKLPADLRSIIQSDTGSGRWIALPSLPLPNCR
jgi:hypothetical protein